MNRRQNRGKENFDRQICVIIPTMAIMILVFFLYPPAQSPQRTIYSSDYSRVAESVRSLIRSKNCGPILIRLAWHDAGTYSTQDKVRGGPKATIRFPTELQFQSNRGLKGAVDLMEPIKREFSFISYADLYQLGAIIAIEEMGGPLIPFRYGRLDAIDEATEASPDGRLPNPSDSYADYKAIFERMGFNGDRAIIALMGAHTVGSMHKDRSGLEGSWTSTPYKFDNSYFVELLEQEWTQDSVVPYQFKNAAGTLVMSTSDIDLLNSHTTKAVVTEFAGDQDLFFKEFSWAYQQLSELNWEGSLHLAFE